MIAARLTTSRKAFTLIEVLVVVAIIGLLIGILAPSLSAARTQSKRVLCTTRLNMVGKGFLSYMHDSNDHMPYASYMPSVDPTPIYIADVLAKHIKDRKVLECPGDRRGLTDRPGSNANRSYYESERSSYEYETRLGGLTPSQFTDITKPPGPLPPDAPAVPSVGKIAPNTVWIMKDYISFHGNTGEKGSFRYLFIDGHAGDFEQY